MRLFSKYTDQQINMTGKLPPLSIISYSQGKGYGFLRTGRRAGNIEWASCSAKRSERSLWYVTMDQLLAILGDSKTQELVQQNYWWQGMILDVNKYINGCLICPWVKPVWAKLLDSWSQWKYQPNHGLPKSAGCNHIINVIDRHSKLLYSGACNTQITAEVTVRLFLNITWCY